MAITTCVTGFPRIHISLVDLSPHSKRMYGGIGFAINAFPIKVQANISEQNRFFSLVPIDDKATKEIVSCIEAFSAIVNINFKVVINSCPPQHIGLGSKTLMILTIFEACNSLLDKQFPREYIQLLSGRGGTSGIGVHTFYEGCIVADIGHRYDNKKGDWQFAPSSKKRAFSIPKVLTRVPFPDEWVIVLLLPEGNHFSGEIECALFRDKTPIPEFEVLKVSSFIYQGILPAILEKNFHDFKDALNEVQKVGFKKIEIDSQSEHLKSTLGALNALDLVAAGMSSFGPLVYAITPRGNARNVQDRINNMQIKHCKNLGIFDGNNSGYLVEKKHHG